MIGSKLNLFHRRRRGRKANEASAAIAAVLEKRKMMNKKLNISITLQMPDCPKARGEFQKFTVA